VNKLSTPDLCAHLDTMKALCDRLEDAQCDSASYQRIIERIRVEAERLRSLVCDPRISPVVPE
jgi:hypothetical protein